MKIPLDNPNFVTWFGSSKVVDSKGQPLVVYHGSQRVDRIGNYFDPRRATSGPMSYFTSDPEIASGYASDKKDTSLKGNSNYDDWFLIKVPGYRNPKSVFSREYWWYLKNRQPDTINYIEKVAPYIHEDEQESGKFYIDTSKASPMPLDSFQWELRQKHGNYLAALGEVWLISGVLFNSEIDFLKILELIGIYNVQYESPEVTRSGIIPVYLRIEHPLDTSNIPEAVVKSLQIAAKQTRQGTQVGLGVDYWDKKYRSPSMWMAQLIQDIQSGKKYAWTSIPDWVTQVLKNTGYDGIIDEGGKYRGVRHAVYIPFYPNQIKSAIGNVGTYSLNSNKIDESKLREKLRLHAGSSLQEKYPVDFSFKTLVNQPTLVYKKQYLKQFFSVLGEGSSRIVFEVDDRHVLKLAINDAGIAQNEAEIQIGKKQNPICIRIINYDPAGSYIETERAEPLEDEKESALYFEYYTGISFKRLYALLQDLGSDSIIYDINQYVIDNYQEELKNKWVQQLIKLAIDNSYVVPGDFVKLSSYGVVKRRTQGKTGWYHAVVLLDLGFTNDVYRNHYY